MSKYSQPPKLAKLILRKIASTQDKYSLVGDVEEEYWALASKNGKVSADFWYRLQVIFSIILYLKYKTYWNLLMLKNYLKIAFRVKSNKGT
jgi:hypothetical protein